ncbi:MAG TPA: hypothetical protein IAA52_12905 [Candidatus Pullichristensenella stercorigallinarum]|uniref:Uncharacterized protein n=1 Tax=Candidatus Pullichristensenella stercorigallinarum TaxID=2840909 RepID=A0A9D0ZNX8_9FIRM|nr:hypothetical protein [Candidatus Pullichristensenella stercorigallinarum]
MESEEKPKRRFWKGLFAAAATSYNISNFGAIAPARIFFPVSAYMAKCEGIRARQFPCKVDPDQKSNQSTHGRFKGQFPFRMRQQASLHCAFAGTTVVNHPLEWQKAALL